MGTTQNSDKLINESQIYATDRKRSRKLIIACRKGAKKSKKGTKGNPIGANIEPNGNQCAKNKS